MNLVKTIRDQLPAETLAKLSSILGVDRESLSSAVSVSVPSMLAGMRGLALQEAGIVRLMSALNSLDDTMFGNFERQLSGDTATMRHNGSALWNGLFGEGISGLESAVSRFTGVGTDAVRSLVAYLAPLVFGRVASHWRNQGGTSAALQSMFADQGRYIDDALPKGFSLRDVAEKPPVGEVHPAAAYTQQPSEMSAMLLVKTVLPLAAVIGAVLLLWNYFDSEAVTPEVEGEVAHEGAEEVTVLKPVTTPATETDVAR